MIDDLERLDDIREIPALASGGSTST